MLSGVDGVDVVAARRHSTAKCFQGNVTRIKDYQSIFSELWIRYQTMCGIQTSARGYRLEEFWTFKIVKQCSWLLTEVEIAVAFCLEAAFIFFTERKEQGRPMPFCVPWAEFQRASCTSKYSYICKFRSWDMLTLSTLESTCVFWIILDHFGSFWIILGISFWGDGSRSWARTLGWGDSQSRWACRGRLCGTCSFEMFVEQFLYVRLCELGSGWLT